MRSRRYINNGAREITAKYDSVCAESGKAIKKGEDCVYYPLDKKIFSMDSRTAQSFRDWKFDCDVLGYNY